MDMNNLKTVFFYSLLRQRGRSHHDSLMEEKRCMFLYQEPLFRILQVKPLEKSELNSIMPVHLKEKEQKTQGLILC